jgi:hypothetical protein
MSWKMLVSDIHDDQIDEHGGQNMLPELFDELHLLKR